MPKCMATTIGVRVTGGALSADTRGFTMAPTTNAMPNSDPVITCCPECHEETFSVVVTDSGSHPDEWGTCHWWEGDGKCTECGHEEFYNDSSH